jgi:hypothetical protein
VLVKITPIGIFIMVLIGNLLAGRAISDVLLNNMCEVLNSKLLDGRDKPIITMLEFVREYLMRRIVNVLVVIDRNNGMLTPYATKLMESIKKEANRFVHTSY